MENLKDWQLCKDRHSKLWYWAKENISRDGCTLRFSFDPLLSKHDILMIASATLNGHMNTAYYKKWQEEKLPTVKRSNMVIDKQTREEWRKLAEEGMHSALGEYTPVDEFNALLDYIDELEETINQLKENN